MVIHLNNLYDYLQLQDVLGNKFQLLNKNMITTFLPYSLHLNWLESSLFSFLKTQIQDKIK